VRTTTTVEDREHEGSRILAMVGPTGVGKTTTLAKLAARARSRGERIAIITIDTYRVAAVEQLRAFADLMAVPFTVAFTASDLRRAIRANADCDRIYVDTTGKSPRDAAAMPLLEGNLRAGECSAILCLAAGTHRRDSDIVLDAFEPLGIHAVCLTKWDETSMPGESVSAVIERGLPLSHLCIGQEVPADIVQAEAAAIAAAAFDTESGGAIA
jgi:flagellar biosynthesis protein FlhF